MDNVSAKEIVHFEIGVDATDLRIAWCLRTNKDVVRDGIEQVSQLFLLLLGRLNLQKQLSLGFCVQVDVQLHQDYRK